MSYAAPTQPLAARSHAKNTAFRIMGALNAVSGQVTYRQRSHTNLACLVDFWYDLRQAYPDATTIYVVVDNWPVLFHPAVLAPLQAQNLPWPPYLPVTGRRRPVKQARRDNLPIQLLCLPTYASWLNPIEKLWRWLKQDVLHLHRLSQDWPALKQAVADFLDPFAAGSRPLLRYVGCYRINFLTFITLCQPTVSQPPLLMKPGPREPSSSRRSCRDEAAP